MAQDLELPADFPPAGARAGAAGHRRTPARRTTARSRSRSSSASRPFKYTTQHQPRRLARRDHASSCFRHARRLLRAVRGVVRGDGARRSACRPGSRSATSPGTLERRRPVPRDEPQRARLAGGVDRRRGLDPVRADARVLGADARASAPAGPRRSRRSPTPTHDRHDGEHADARTAAAPTLGAGSRRRGQVQTAAPPTVDAPRRAQRASTAVAIALGAVALGVLGFFAIAVARALAARPAAPARSRPPAACARRVGRSARPARASPASRRGRRPRRWSSRCATRPRTARATPGPR